jgi:hypothetical protein
MDNADLGDDMIMAAISIVTLFLVVTVVSGTIQHTGPYGPLAPGAQSLQASTADVVGLAVLAVGGTGTIIGLIYGMGGSSR